MKISIITINYNSSENTLKLLKSLQAQTDQDFQMIVVDNASDEADFDVLQQATKGTFVKVPFVIRNDKNLGFSGGNNVGIREALRRSSLREASGQAEWVVLLNPDTWAEKAFMASLKAKLRPLDPSTGSGQGGVVGIPLIEGDKTAYRGKIEWLRSTLSHIYNPAYADYLRKNTNYYAIGGAMAIRKDVFDKTGFLDEKYFLYFEDADFSLRARQAGYEVNFIEEPKVHHQVSAVTKKLGSSLLLRYHYRNAFYFNLKNGPGYIKFLIWFWSFWVMNKQLLKIMLMYRQEESLAILKGVFDFYRNKMGKI